jgi:hypothetical protein
MYANLYPPIYVSDCSIHYTRLHAILFNFFKKRHGIDLNESAFGSSFTSTSTDVLFGVNRAASARAISIFRLGERNGERDDRLVT